MKRKKLWSVTRITHPKYPRITVRVGEVQKGGILQVFRWLDGRQTMRSLQCRRLDLGSTLPQQREEARRLGCEFIEDLVTKPKGNGAAPDSGSPLTLYQLTDKYEADGFAGRTANYKRDALSSIRRIADFVGVDHAVREIKPSDVQKYLAHRMTKAPVAARGDLVALSIACNWAVGEGLLEGNPLSVKRARDAMKIEHQPRRPWLSQEQFEQLQKVSAKLPPAFPVLLDLAWHTGRRIAAILGLKWCDVLFDAKAAFHQCKDLDSQADWKVSDFSNGGIRWYAGLATNKKRRDHVSPMHPAARAALERWQKVTGGVGQRYVFVAPSDASKPLARFLAKRWLRQAERLAKLPHQRQGGWHMFRRGWKTARKHLPLKDVARAGDWKDLMTPLLNYEQPDRQSTLAAINFGG